MSVVFFNERFDEKVLLCFSLTLSELRFVQFRLECLQ